MRATGHIPLKEGLRPPKFYHLQFFCGSCHRPYSTKRRIKTYAYVVYGGFVLVATGHIPLKEGLRHLDFKHLA